MRVALKRAKHFITCGGKYYGAKNELAVRGLLAAAENNDSAVQTDMFSLLPQTGLLSERKRLYSDRPNAIKALTGEL